MGPFSEFMNFLKYANVLKIYNFPQKIQVMNIFKSVEFFHIQKHIQIHELVQTRELFPKIIQIHELFSISENSF